MKKVERPVFIVGTGRSGTTILGVMLSIHKDVGFLNEPKAMWHSIYPKEDIIGSYSTKEGRFRLEAKDASQEVIINAHKLYGAYLRYTASQCVVDKYPELIFRIPFIKQIFPDARFIFLVRNGWDTCYSIKRWSERLGEEKSGKMHDWWGVNNRKWTLLVEQIVSADMNYKCIFDAEPDLTNHIDMAMVEWIVTMQEGLKQMQLNPDCFLKVKFEEFTQDPQKELKRIFDFCDLCEDQNVFNYAQKTISPVRAHPQLEIHPCLQELVEETTCALGGY